jgi:GPH family glycoside/pentoside/hexuronide:cation symporter
LYPPLTATDNSANQLGAVLVLRHYGDFLQYFYTAVNLPYTALTPELTQDYNERTTLNSFRFAFSIGGSILSVIFWLGSSLPQFPKIGSYSIWF